MKHILEARAAMIAAAKEADQRKELLNQPNQLLPEERLRREFYWGDIANAYYSAVRFLDIALSAELRDLKELFIKHDVLTSIWPPSLPRNTRR